MNTSGHPALVLAGVLTLLAAAAHLACIALGAPAYRLTGAGGRIVRAVEEGRPQPALVTLAVALVLVGWAAYAFAAAGAATPLPLTRWVLPAIAAVLLGRPFGFAWIKPMFPGNSERFWRVSSALCLALGALYAWGSVAIWERLGPT